MITEHASDPDRNRTLPPDSPLPGASRGLFVGHPRIASPRLTSWEVMCCKGYFCLGLTLKKTPQTLKPSLRNSVSHTAVPLPSFNRVHYITSAFRSCSPLRMAPWYLNCVQKSQSIEGNRSLSPSTGQKLLKLLIGRCQALTNTLPVMWT